MEIRHAVRVGIIGSAALSSEPKPPSIEWASAPR